MSSERLNGTYTVIKLSVKNATYITSPFLYWKSRHPSIRRLATLHKNAGPLFTSKPHQNHVQTYCSRFTCQMAAQGPQWCKGQEESQTSPWSWSPGRHRCQEWP